MPLYAEPWFSILTDEARFLVKEIGQWLTWEGKQIDTRIGYENNTMLIYMI